MEPELVFISAFLVIFGIFYLHYSTRNKERLALIEKGADANIFVKSKKEGGSTPVWKILLLNLGLLSIGIGLGIIIPAILIESLNIGHEIEQQFYVAAAFITSGISLIVGFFLTRKFFK